MINNVNGFEKNSVFACCKVIMTWLEKKFFLTEFKCDIVSDMEIKSIQFIDNNSIR